MVASADGLATQAGLALLRGGGTAADAAIAANAVLAVTGPHLCGMGGDLFALVHHEKATPAALNASGRAGSGADPARLRAEGHTSMPFRGHPASITVPGCVDGWLTLHERFGRLGLAEVLAPAVGYAEQGFPASPLLAASVRGLPTPLPDGAEAYRGLTGAGQLVTRPGVGRALRAIAASGRDGFYDGEFGAGLVTLASGLVTADDLARSGAEWVTPISVRAWDHDLWTIPPNSQGYLTLASAWIAEQLDLGADPDAGAWAVGGVEAAIAASYDRPAVLFDGADGASLVRSERLEARRAMSNAPTLRGPQRFDAGDTTYLCAIDGNGMGVSLIQSNASGFGSHLFEPATGINLHNRGIGFSLEPGHPAELGPGRRPPHTLAPALVTGSDGELHAVLGTQGGDGQPQILLQVLARLLGAGQSPGRAIGSRRWVLTGSGQGFDTWTADGGPIVVVEDGAPAAWTLALEARGHHVRAGAAFDHGFGHANLIVRQPNGMLAGAADPRARVGSAAGY